MKTVEDVQAQLKALGLYNGEVDGIHGAMTSQAIVKFQFMHPPLPPNGKVSDKLLTLLFPEDIADRVDAPKPTKNKVQSPYPHQNDVRKFYGNPGENQTGITLPYPMRLAWDLNTKVKTLTCHKKVADSMLSIFQETLDRYGIDKIRALHLDSYGGCLNVRKMRGGNRYSMHSWGIAVDIDPARNQLRWNRKKAQLAKPEYDDFWDIVQANGATSLGKARDYDWMHFQFAHL